MTGRTWEDLAVIASLRRQRATAPRQTGLTMIIDTGLGLRATEDVLEVAGDFIDLWKFSFGTSVFLKREVLRRKIALINACGIMTCPGGTLFEAAILQHHCRVYMDCAAETGFTAVEISDGTIDLPAHRRQRVIACARDVDLVVVSEVGKKDPKAQPALADLAQQALRDLEDGAQWVIVEGRESGKGVGVYDDAGLVAGGAFDVFASAMGPLVERLIWEAPLKSQQAALVERFGVNVGLGNVAPTDVLALEALRAGLRFETLKPIADGLAASGDWIPGQLEPAPGVVSAGLTHV
jgi:phosphosulfolactate synthase